MYLGWHDADRRRTVEQKLTDAIDRYAEKFGADPEIALVGPHDFPEAAKATTLVTVREVGFLPRHTFYVGVDDLLEERDGTADDV